MRDQNFHDPEISKMEERKERLREEFEVYYAENDFTSFDDIADWWLARLEEYADEAIDQVFEEQENKNKGKVKVRTENGIMWLTDEELEEYKSNQQPLNGKDMKEGKYKKHYRCPLCLGKGKVMLIRRYSPTIRAKARKLFRSGWSLREIGKEVGIKAAQQVKSLIMSKTL